jgi:hypothetical protein
VCVCNKRKKHGKGKRRRSKYKKGLNGECFLKHKWQQFINCTDVVKLQCIEIQSVENGQTFWILFNIISSAWFLPNNSKNIYCIWSPTKKSILFLQMFFLERTIFLAHKMKTTMNLYKWCIFYKYVWRSASSKSTLYLQNCGEYNVFSESM